MKALNCPACRQSVTDEPFWEIPQAPVFCNVLWPSRDEALQAERAPIRLVMCRQCGLIFNASFDPALVQYSPGYENALHFSPRFRQYAEALARSLIEQHGLRGKNVVEIGCGEGHFLSLLCRLGGNRGTGYDPSYSSDRLDEPLPEGAEILASFLDQSASGLQADLLCCRHVLEHIDQPVEFLRMLRRLVDRQQTVMFFEVPNAQYMLQSASVWDVIYEHCMYFAPESLANAFRMAGFEPISVEPGYDGQFLTIQARPDSRWPETAPPLPPSQRLIELAEGFDLAYRQALERWTAWLNQDTAGDTVIWGAGSKGVSFLNATKADWRCVARAVDLNPRKQGRYLPRTAQQVVSPEALSQQPPARVILTNSIYRNEIAQLLDSMNVAAQIVLA